MCPSSHVVVPPRFTIAGKELQMDYFGHPGGCMLHLCLPGTPKKPSFCAIRAKPPVCMSPKTETADKVSCGSSPTSILNYSVFL